MTCLQPRTLSILLIEDDEDDFVITRQLLAEVEGAAYTLSWVSGYEEGLEALLQGSYDLYFVDYHLGLHTGLELLQTAIAGGCQKPIILLTGLGDRAVDQTAMQLGAADYLVKGQIFPALLERSIRHAVERAKTLEELRISQERYQLAAKGANDGLWDWDLVTDEVYFSPRWKAMLSYPDEEISSSPEEWFSRVHSGDSDRLKADLDNHLQGKTPHFENEHRLQGGDGVYHWVLSRGLAIRQGEKPYRIAGSLTLLTNRAAFYDVLTGLPNRTLFMDRLEQAVKRGERHPDALFAVMFLDLDGFKLVNDSLGHLMGDRLLTEISGRLEQCLRIRDTVARLGGDEFTILIEDVNTLGDVLAIADRIHQALSQPFNLNQNEVFITASIGVTLSAGNATLPQNLLQQADQAMYQAKKLGRGRSVIYDSTMHYSMLQRLQLETDLRKAIQKQEFQVHYQPIIALSSGAIAGVEALVRWHHPTQGFVAPSEFIPIAEETGLIVSIGLQVLQIACCQVQRWNRELGLNLDLSVNFSLKEFAQPDLVMQVKQVLQECQLAPQSLKLEITETTVLEDGGNTLNEKFTQLKSLGVQLHIDDFGTGYSSLSRLRTLPIDCLKIDRSFIDGIKTDDNDTEIVASIISLAHNLKLEVIAEGVETANQLNFLRQLGCDFGQGYFISKPLDVETSQALLRANPRW
jgi:diguanylate cyclase (GGDEF)-like protein